MKRKQLKMPAEHQIPSIKIGFGYDVHRLVGGRKLMLGGVRIPSELGLLGHSDADVLLHAICDAILGAAALGDIGKHFPNSDESLRGISSLKLLYRVGDLVKKQGLRVGNIDSTVILERPKIAQYTYDMQEKISKTLKISLNQVSIKATTNEGLGSLGRGEGAAAFAVASLYTVKIGL